MSVQFSDMEGHKVVETALRGACQHLRYRFIYDYLSRPYLVIFLRYENSILAYYHSREWYYPSREWSFSFLFTLCPYIRYSTEY